MATSLITAVSGLIANQQMLDVVGNNLANANTTGYKNQEISFADLLYQSLRPASGSTTTFGGTNPAQIGQGVAVAAIDRNLQQGTLQSTGNSMDMALQGNGYFVLSGGAGNVFSRAGSFGLDQNQDLVDLATGYRVQRFGSIGEPSGGSTSFQVPGDNSIKIPIGTGIPGQATMTVDLQGNVSANASGPLAQVLTTTQPFLAGGAPATAATALSSLDINTTPYGAGDQLVLQGTAPDGTAVNATIPVPATMGGLLTAIDAAFPGATASLDAQGNLVVQSNTTGPSKLQLTISDAAGNTGQSSWGQNSLIVTTTGKDGDTIPTAIQFYDSQGRAHSLNLTLQKQGANVWSLTGSIPQADGTVVGGVISGITFNQDGSFQQVTGGGTGNLQMTFQLNGIASLQTIRFDFGSANGFNGLTQFGGTSSAAATGQDGFAAGTLSSISVGLDGVISGVFTNGQTKALAQLAIAQFANDNGLSQEGQNYLTATTQSGEPLIGAGSTGGRGEVQSGVLESSNVDVSLEFTRLIIAQNGFQMNARAISVSDQVLQDLASLIR